MDIRLKKKIKEYFSSIYLFDVVVVSTITLFLISEIGDYVQNSRIDYQIVSDLGKNLIVGLIILLIYIVYIIKLFIIIKRDPKSPQIKSKLINNIVYVMKNGFNYDDTRKTLIISMTVLTILLITYLYFLATGGYENNIFVRFFKTYPFKGTILIIILLFLATIYIIKKTLDVIMVNDALKKVNEGNWEEDIKLEGSPAIEELAHNINLIKKIYDDILYEGVKNEKLKTELISNVSHDLKTPLTSIINYVNILKNPDITEEERTEYLLILEKKSLKLKSLIEDLFEMSKINSGKIKLNKELIDLLSLIHQEVGEYSTLYEEKNISFKVTSEEESIYMELDGKLMSRALENVIVNALKYSMDNTRIYIKAEKEENNVKISIKNIANYEMDFNESEIFERFARGDKSRNSKVEGSGLGLAITKSIIELHGGEVNIKREGDMFKLYISLPIN